MKRILLFLLILFYPIVGFSAIDEFKTDVYFANGILTTPSQAEYNTYVVLQSAIQKELYGNDEDKMKKHIGKVDYAYNETNGFILDNLESGLQKFGWTWIADFFNASHGRDLQKQIIKYQDSIKLGHKVLVVAHSQGNLFTYEAYEELKKRSKDGWMRYYFQAVSIASPMTEDISLTTPRIDWDNDLVARIATLGSSDSTDIGNNVRKVYWKDVGEPYIIDEYHPVIVEPSNSYVFKSQLNEVYKEKWKAIENGIDSNVHAFTFYMGHPIKNGDTGKIFYNPLDTSRSTLSDGDARSRIMTAIRTQLFLLEEEPSQYITDSVCQGTATVKHKHAPETIDDIANVFIVSESGKVFDDGIGYVKADQNEEIDRSNLPDEPPIVPKGGIITVQLSWEDSKIDMNLKVGMPFGEQDIADVLCKPIEHFYVATEEDVSPGTYPVYVSNSDGADVKLIPQNVYLTIHTPGEAMTFDFEITASDMLNIGHVANIIINEDKKVHFEYTPLGMGNPPDITHYVDSGNDRDDNDTTDYNEYIYTVQSALKQALLGPLSNADIELTEAKGFHSNAPLYTSATTGGNSLLTSGLLYFPSRVLNTLDDESYYVVSIIGGDDIDVDDDGELDTAATPSIGTIRAILSGRQLKNENFKVNILTEALFQLTKEMLTDEHNIMDVAKNLDVVTQKLLIADVNKDEIIDYNDALWWLPIFDKAKLLKPYATSYQPIAEKIYRDEEIYDDVYALINDPYLRTQKMQVSEDAQVGTIIGKVHIDLYEGTAAYTISGEDSSFFEIDNEGIVTLSDDAQLDYETRQEYTMYVTAQIDTEMLNAPLIINVSDILDAPALGGFISFIDENSPGGTSVGKLYVNPGLSSVTEIVLQGKGSKKFTVDLEGNIAVASEVILDYETQNSYRLYAVARNSYGHSLTAAVKIILQDLPEAPVLQVFKVTVDENAETGTVVGTLVVIENGSPVTSIELSGEGNEDFNIETNGTITLSPTAQLDYSSRASYILQAQAANTYGNSTIVTVNIGVMPATPQLLGSYYAPGSPESIVLSSNGTIAYVTDYSNGLHIIDISDPTAPKGLGSYDPQGFTRSITLSSDSTIAYIANGYSGLQIIDVTDPLAPQRLRGYDTPGYAYGVTLSSDGSVAYVADGYRGGLQIIDIADPTGPRLLGSSYDTLYDARSVALSSDGTIAYVVDNSGLQIIDISDPGTVRQLGSHDTSGYARSVALSSDGTIVYVLDIGSGFQIIDVTDPLAPRWLGSYDALGDPRSITLSADSTIAYVTDGYRGLQIIDISDSTVPRWLGSQDTPGYAHSVTLSADGDIAYVADSKGLQIIHLGPFAR